MKKINFKQPKYVIPIMVFVFANYMFYILFASNKKEEKVVLGVDELQVSVSDISSKESEKNIEDRFDAYQKHYNLDNRDNNLTAIGDLEDEIIIKDEFEDIYSSEEANRLAFERERLRLVEEDLKRQQNEISSGGYSSGQKQDDELMALLKMLNENENKPPETFDEGMSSIDVMKYQLQMLDSLEKAHDPDYQQLLKEEENERMFYELQQKERLSKLTVNKISHNPHFNTIMRDEEGEFIKAIIDEEITGYAGSRIRIRLLEPVKVGNFIIEKDSYLYALITGFNDQRVRLNIMSVKYKNKILPIKLAIYDVDGMEGLYVPSSQFREFSKELGQSTMQGMNLSTSSGDSQQQFFTSIIDRAFTSTSNTIAGMIRKNRAKLKYNTFIYLIDDEMLSREKEMIYKENLQNN